jgi:hypothetical protein
MDTRNSRVLRDFTQYCLEHPEERFWQALRNWSGYQAVLTGIPDNTKGFGYQIDRDTFYFEGREGDNL